MALAFRWTTRQKVWFSAAAVFVTWITAGALTGWLGQIFETNLVTLPAIAWLSYGYIQIRILFERHTKVVLALLGSVLLLGLCLGGLLLDYDPVTDVQANASARGLGPQWGHLLGTDFVGRDMLMLLIKGTEGFFLPGLLAMVIALGFGVTMGAVAGYVGGRTDRVISFVITLLGSFPRLVFILLCCTIADDPDMFLIGGLVGALFIPQIAEAIRRRVLSLKEEDFILAARAHGLSVPRVLFYHIVWLQCFPEIVRQGLYLFVYVIFVETALSYLELETMAFEASSWGKMLNDAKDMMIRGTYWHAIVPTAAIVFATLGATSLGDIIVGQAKQERL